ncbi:conserved hypothetical protein [Neospora caninum Liverpool]|uniref:Uncharacterized protein n=1 Tax=Neospora caninum (strain Liverpool) TaxID=572307 RepID=F0VPH0_NEOCL|nr:conserved hypothetical protein [Neospora caninum Liverpool]CBZ55616.1 conserved hypothetical protein [Neospora caninum Liverpool]CEL70358.1 TPA: hypothetical protein BN1204_060410 [Neospora caninum Liverpool]|eukprot:XP_003885644.1 conserved hypothetical protein [Neospora caninum Liverpool]
MAKEEKRGGVGEDEAVLATAQDEAEDQEEMERQRNLQVTADYTLISRGLVQMSHVQLEASRAPEELPAPDVGDWVESKAAHQDAQIFRAKVVERRRCPENIWVFRLRSPDMASTYIEPLKHVRKDSVWSLAREMDLAGGRKARRVSQQPRRPSTVPSSGRSQSTGSASPRASSGTPLQQSSAPSLAPSPEGSLHSSGGPSDSLSVSVLPGSSTEEKLLSSSLPSPSTSSVSAPSAASVSAFEGEERRRKTTGDGADRRTPMSQSGEVFILPGEKKVASLRQLETNVSPSLSFPRRSLPAYHHLEKILMRTKLSFPSSVRPSFATPSPRAHSPVSSLSLSAPGRAAAGRLSGSAVSHDAFLDGGENVDRSNAPGLQATPLAASPPRDAQGKLHGREESDANALASVRSQKKFRPSEGDAPPARRRSLPLSEDELESGRTGVSEVEETQATPETTAKTRKAELGGRGPLSPVSSPATRKAPRPLSALVRVGGSNGSSQPEP